MEYSKLVSVTGLPGLYELISSKGDGAVIRSLDDGSTKFAATRSHNFSHLESIEVYTQRENVNLVDVFTAIDKAGGSLPDTKDTAALKKYFEKVYPEMDFERVYPSDMKKMVKWYEQLKKHNIEIKLTEIPEEPIEEVKETEAAEEENMSAASEKKAKPAKKAAKEPGAKTGESKKKTTTTRKKKTD
jgi:Domain of unknown function (DUF6852)/Domain of unknown function (DUF5606)